ncbi:MAG: cytochrome c biogenesis protein ResB [Thermoguttaceae bacterium]|nr:cytochrome c biogenesis protein ResB [Thermoguttaceae bacterium]
MKPILSVVRFLGSMYFAIGLILILAVVMAWATFLGMQFGDDASAWCVYHAGWFLVLCGLLGLSVLVSALLRWPWKKFQTGFLVTHLGILVLLAGCWIDFRFSQSAFLTVAEGETNSVAVCPGDVHFDVRWTPADVQKGEKEFHETLRFEPGPFSWRFYGQKGGLSPVPWSWAGRNHAGDQLRAAAKSSAKARPEIEVVDWLRLGTAAAGQEEPKTVEDFAWEVAQAGGNPKGGTLSKAEMKRRTMGWTSWVKVRVTLDGESREAWLRQFDFFSPDGLERNTPSESDRTLWVFQSQKGSRVQLVYAQNTVALNFGVQLDRFNNRLDPGTSMASHYSSDVTILDQKMNVSMNQPVDISEPKTGQVWRLFQTSYGGPFLNRSARVDQRDQFYTSTFTLRYSPGRGLLYLGCLLVVLGIGIMFSMKAYFFGRG